MTKYNDVNRVTIGKSFDSDWTVHISGNGAAESLSDVPSYASLCMVFDEMYSFLN